MAGKFMMIAVAACVVVGLAGVMADLDEREASWLPDYYKLWEPVDRSAEQTKELLDHLLANHPGAKFNFMYEDVEQLIAFSQLSKDKCNLESLNSFGAWMSFRLTMREQGVVNYLNHYQKELFNFCFAH